MLRCIKHALMAQRPRRGRRKAMSGGFRWLRQPYDMSHQMGSGGLTLIYGTLHDLHMPVDPQQSRSPIWTQLVAAMS